jgi:hypothetical protein
LTNRQKASKDIAKNHEISSEEEEGEAKDEAEEEEEEGEAEVTIDKT